MNSNGKNTLENRSILIALFLALCAGDMGGLASNGGVPAVIIIGFSCLGEDGSNTDVDLRFCGG